MNKHFRVSGSTFQKLEELGVSAAAVLRRAGLPQGYGKEPRVLLKTEELFALWRAIGEVSTNPAIGLQLGVETRTERFHPIGLAALSSENFGAAIDQLARYKQLTCPEEIRQEKDDEEWRIQFRWLLADEVEPPVLNECCFAWVLSIARIGTGARLLPLRVEFVQPRAHAKMIERHFGCPVISGAPRNAIVFRASDDQRPFVTRNAELLAMLAPQLEEELKQENGDENFIERVRVAIQQKLTGRRPDVDEIADALHISSRTLQRRLQDEASSFQRVLASSPLERLKIDDWDRMIDVNIKGVLYGIAAALPYMKQQKAGHIINVSSVAGHKVRAGGAVYAATKHAVLALSEGLRLEVKPYNIRTTVISPGAVAMELPGSVTEPDLAENMQHYYEQFAIPVESFAQVTMNTIASVF